MCSEEQAQTHVEGEQWSGFAWGGQPVAVLGSQQGFLLQIPGPASGDLIGLVGVATLGFSEAFGVIDCSLSVSHMWVQHHSSPLSVITFLICRHHKWCHVCLLGTCVCISWMSSQNRNYWVKQHGISNVGGYC